jgi:hypothetical protein
MTVSAAIGIPRFVPPDIARTSGEMSGRTKRGELREKAHLA